MRQTWYECMCHKGNETILFFNGRVGHGTACNNVFLFLGLYFLMFSTCQYHILHFFIFISRIGEFYQMYMARFYDYVEGST